MFGVIVAPLDNLDDDEKARYQQLYCGICHSLKDRYGQISRLCVSFDMAFLATLLESLFERGERKAQGRCVVHPNKPHYYIGGEYIDYAADMSLVLAYHKCIDNWIDDKSASSFAYRYALERAYRLVEASYPSIVRVTEEMLSRIRDLESKSLALLSSAKTNDNGALSDELLISADDIARCFGAVMGMMFCSAPHVDNSPWKETLFQLGYELGRFVYFMDAAVDKDEDRDNNVYNPFNASNYAEEDVQLILDGSIGSATCIFERLPLERDLHLLRSVLYAGVWQKLFAKQHGPGEDE